MSLRSLAQRPLDTMQFYVDLYPGLPYQPLPWLGLHTAKRCEGTQERWAAIQSEATAFHVATALDIGSNVGYFCLRLSELGIGVVGLEMCGRFYRLAAKAAEALPAANRPVFIHQMLSPEDRFPLPDADLVLCLSVWHHWVRAFGFEHATAILKRVWGHCGRVMIFETGEAEVAVSYRLPDMRPDPRTWLAEYLSRVTGGEVRHLGLFKAFGPGGDEQREVVHRNLFAVVRTGAEIPLE